jgi:hypothetical protein
MMSKSYFSSDLSKFVCASCEKESATVADTLVVYGDVPYPFCSEKCQEEWSRNQEG